MPKGIYKHKGGIYKHSEETKRKIGLANSKSLKGRKLSDEHRKKISEVNKRMGKIPPSRKGLPSPMKGKKLSEEHKLKLSLANKGERNYFWLGGKSFEEYSVNWTETLKRSIRERDRYICRICGELQGNIAFDIHHIDYDKKNCNPKNLITLCKKCHSKTNFSRDYWVKYFLGEEFEK